VSSVSAEYGTDHSKIAILVIINCCCLSDVVLKGKELLCLCVSHCLISECSYFQEDPSKNNILEVAFKS
jgi:hypothetical protein